MKQKTNFTHRVGIRLTDGQYYTLQNLSNFYNLTVTDFIKKSCGIIDIDAQQEFEPQSIDGEIEMIDVTPDGVIEGNLTLKQYHDTNNSLVIEHMFEDIKEKVNILFNEQYCNPDEDYSDEETGRILKGESGLPAKADELCYNDCVNTIAYNYKQFGVTPENLMNYIKTNMIPETEKDEDEEN